MMVQRLAAWLAVVGLCAGAIGEAGVADMKSVAYVMEAGKPLGEVTVKIELGRNKDQLRVIVGMTITSASGVKVEVPKEALQGIVEPQLERVTVASDGDKGVERLFVSVQHGVAKEVQAVAVPPGEPFRTYIHTALTVVDGKLTERVDAGEATSGYGQEFRFGGMKAAERKVVWKGE